MIISVMMRLTMAGGAILGYVLSYGEWVRFVFLFWWNVLC